MENKYLAIAISTILAVTIGLLVFFVFANGDNSSSSGDSSFFPIWIAMLPIWISVGTASREKRKRDEKATRKRKQKEEYVPYAEDDNDYEQKALSAFDGELVSFDQPEQERQTQRRHII